MAARQRRHETWTKWLTGSDRVEVTIQTRGFEVLDFSVQYLAHIGSDWHPIVRFDTAHGDPHIDVMQGDKEKRTIELGGMDKSEALTYALDEIDRRWETYRGRYEENLNR